MAGQEQVLYAFHLNRSLTSAEESALRQKFDWLGRLNGQTLLIRAGADQQQTLAALPYAQSVAPYQPAQKLAPEFKKPEQQNKGQNKPPATEQAPKRLTLTITVGQPGDKTGVIALVKSLGGQVLEAGAADGRYLRVALPEAQMLKLAGSPLVLYIEKYENPELLNDRAKDIVGARPLAVPNFVTAPGLNGKRQVIGLADSGLDIGSITNLPPDLATAPGEQPRVVMLKSWAGAAVPADTNGHGTHLAATLVGSGQASDGRYAGVAPEASLYFQAIMDNQGNLTPPMDLHDLFQPAYDAGVRVHVDGWGNNKNVYTSAAAQVDDFVRRHPDFLPLFGAGNSGPREGTVTAEANSKNALVVGASGNPRPALENTSTGTMNIASFSSRGPASDGRLKPELVAPGTSVISAASRLVEGNLQGRPDYTMMQGTSMATAVTGGAAALLRQYYEQYGYQIGPSAALLKATLINGAQRLEQPPQTAGFGLLDLSGTVVALANGLFQAQDNRQGLAEGGSVTYEQKITYADAPLKATLVWTDPAAAPGTTAALVNNLDLAVIGPDGKEYYGNDFERQGTKDTVNNVEQVEIPHPAPGVYKIVVRAVSVRQDATGSGKLKQDYALVYGQPPVRETVLEGNQNQVTLADGKQLLLPKDTIAVVNDRRLTANEKVAAGTDLYLIGPADQPQRAYLVGRIWRADGVKTMVADGQTVVVQINQDYRDGGYAVAPEAGDALGSAVPAGASVTAGINPRSQTIWHADISGSELSGVLAGVDQDNRRIRLLDNQNVYALAAEAVIAFSDVIVDGDPADLPFGASMTTDLANLLPGMPVQITLGSDGRIYNLVVNRHIAVGRIKAVAPDAPAVTMGSGNSYKILPGINITQDGQAVTLSDLRQGELAILDLVPDTNEVLSLTVYSNVSYGRVIYAEKDTLYLMDNARGYINPQLNQASQVFRWGMAAGTSILKPGQWVRVITDPVSGAVWRVDVGEAAEKTASLFEQYIPGQGVKLANGNLYRVSDVTVITKNSYPVPIQSFKPGEQVTVTPLYGPGGQQIAMALEAQTGPGVKPPQLTVLSAIPSKTFLLVSGQTNASHLYVVLYPNLAVREINIGSNGDFYYPIEMGADQQAELVAVDEATGGVTGLQLNSALPSSSSLGDIAGHWAEGAIRELMSRGILAGYPDGTFKPNRAVNRAEFTVLTTRLIGVGIDSTAPGLPYADAAQIPSWAKDAVALAYNRGLAVGYSDHTFRPGQPITREEAATLLVRLYRSIRGGGAGPAGTAAAADYKDQSIISTWALADVRTARQLGLLSGKPGNLFAPQDNITRAETAAAVSRLLSLLSKDNQN
ncbi:MAG: S8 family serine peptidase [Firmicutes bacterium]|nr:S8 family serine peptidase [Bacillota bacterium]